ncbi:Obg family GTPase CgtA [Candidatus Purcelliella pentastirinorum]|nr:Obg family GTPase CgtA [Candidatus Purcelliella pentastirinorum]WDI78964.1 Obg family GTPase CgtA [Candidatus Purcelliella pentastirinorum]WDR80100.1 Obg family GTPase CgtA [Candidatus Purcelliella pentastirinorum]
MKFVDEVVICASGGTGGNGCISFKHNKNMSYPIPDGGDGGDGGNVWLLADRNLSNLIDYKFKKYIIASNGKNGGSNGRSGKNGRDIIIKVPIGTLIIDYDTGATIIDIINCNQKILLVKGGKKGLGNIHCKLFSNSFLNNKNNGSISKKHFFLFRFIFLANVGMLGMPNVGKSTFVTKISNVKSKIGLYPFTTIRPHLGVVRLNKENCFTIADIPGLIEGASKGVGMGVDFLKHLERCDILLHMISLSSMKVKNIINDINIIIYELTKYKNLLSNKTCWLLFNKMDLFNLNEIKDIVNAVIKKLCWKSNYYIISAINNTGIKNLCWDIVNFINKNISKM